MPPSRGLAAMGIEVVEISKVINKIPFVGKYWLNDYLYLLRFLEADIYEFDS